MTIRHHLGPLLITLPLLTLGTLGCAGPPVPGGESAAQAQGARIWASTCHRCHNLRPPRQFTPEEWPVIVSHMRTRADLTRSQARAVADYLRRATGSGSGGRTSLGGHTFSGYDGHRPTPAAHPPPAVPPPRHERWPMR